MATEPKKQTAAAPAPAEAPKPRRTPRANLVLAHKDGSLVCVSEGVTAAHDIAHLAKLGYAEAEDQEAATKAFAEQAAKVAAKRDAAAKA